MKHKAATIWSAECCSIWYGYQNKEWTMPAPILPYHLLGLAITVVQFWFSVVLFGFFIAKVILFALMHRKVSIVPSIFCVEFGLLGNALKSCQKQCTPHLNVSPNTLSSLENKYPLIYTHIHPNHQTPLYFIPYRI